MLQKAGIDREGGRKHGVRLRAGYDALIDASATPLRGPELIRRASVAFGRAKAGDNGDWLAPFQAPTPTPQRRRPLH